MNELEIYDDADAASEGGEQARRGVQVATIVPHEKRLIALLAAILGLGSGGGAGYVGMQVAQAQTEQKVELNTKKIEEVAVETTSAVQESEKRVAQTVTDLKVSLDKHVESQEQVNREILRALGRLEGELKSLTKK